MGVTRGPARLPEAERSPSVNREASSSAGPTIVAPIVAEYTVDPQAPQSSSHVARREAPTVAPTVKNRARIPRLASARHPFPRVRWTIGPVNVSGANERSGVRLALTLSSGALEKPPTTTGIATARAIPSARRRLLRYQSPLSAGGSTHDSGASAAEPGSGEGGSS